MALRLSLVLALLGLFILLAFARPAGAEPVEIHYAPVENLEHVDVELLRSARAKIDIAAYSLTDWLIIDTLIDAHRRGVAVRIVLDPSQQHALDRMREIAGNIRMKAPGPYMHLKSYAVDGQAPMPMVYDGGGFRDIIPRARPPEIPTTAAVRPCRSP